MRSIPVAQAGRILARLAPPPRPGWRTGIFRERRQREQGQDALRLQWAMLTAGDERMYREAEDDPAA